MSKFQTEQPQNLAQKYIYVIIAIAFICICTMVYKKKKREKHLQEQALVSAQQKLKDNQQLTPSERQSLGRGTFDPTQHNKNRVHLGTQRRSPPIPRPAVPTFREVQAQKSAAAVKSFTKEAFIQVPMPGNFNYSTLDLPEGFAGIYGFDAHTKARVTGLAYKNVATPDQVASFLKTDGDSIPNIAQNPVSHLSEPQTLPPPSSPNGLSGGTLWNGVLQNGDQVAVVYVEREDKRGSYMFVLSGSHTYFEKNDGAFDSLYDKARALNEKGQ